MKKKIAAKDFETFVSMQGKKFSTRTIEMARLVLVAGRQQKEVAATFGVTNGAVSQVVHRVLRAIDACDITEIPHGHERITVVLPKEEARLVKALESAHKKRRNRTT